MKKLREIWKKLNIFLSSFLLIFIISKYTFANEIIYEIYGNEFTDSEVILSILNDITTNLDEEYSNEILKTLNNSNLFSDVSVEYVENKYIIQILEFPNINKLYFENNDRIKDDELKLLASQINFKNFNNTSINLFISEIEKAYQSFGYNDVQIEYSQKLYENTNTIDLFFDINEGKITKINKIFFSGNENILADELKQIINSKIKTFRNIFANNNYKPNISERDKYLIVDYYKENGFLDVSVKLQIEYLQSNKVNIYFNIKEGNLYSLAEINIKDNNEILSLNTLDIINKKINNFVIEHNNFSYKKLQLLESELTSIIIDSGIDFFEIITLEKIDNLDISIMFEITSIEPKYANQINIIGNTRTFDYVIRRELEIVEGDAIHKSQINRLKNKLSSLNLFESVSIKEELLDNNFVNLIIEVEEKQTGTFNAGVSVGTLDGFAIVTGLRERNFYGTGRSLDVLINTSEDKNQFKLITTDRLSYSNDADISYSVNYKQQDFSKSSSYKLDTFSSGIGISYRINENTNHSIDLEYALKDYKITNSSSVSDSIKNSSGGNMSYLLKNNLRFSTLNPGFISKKGNLINFNNTIETPTSSKNGFVRNILTLKKYYTNNNNNIYSIQTKVGNIFSLNNNDILTDDKFALGGRWLRGFDNFGVGPRNSQTSYIGGNNIIATKLDYSYEFTKNSNFPIYLNIFNDYGLIWENKTKPTNSDNSLRASAGFGIKYYSPIGPIGFSWGFPLMDEDYDIKRMFLFSIGNLD